MKKIKLIYIFYLSIIPLLLSGGISVHAEDGSSQVTMRSSINFIEAKDKVEKTKSSGILPQTGEIIRQYFPAMVGIVLIILLIIILIKRRKKYED